MSADIKGKLERHDEGTNKKVFVVDNDVQGAANGVHFNDKIFQLFLIGKSLRKS